jgi:hypothetical protein
MKTQTDQAYQRHQRLFIVWCNTRSIEPAAASATAIDAYLREVISATPGRGTVWQVCAALDRWFVEQGCDLPPTRSELVRATARVPSRGPGALRFAPVEVARMMEMCPPAIMGLRDRAVIAHVARTRMRCSAVVSMRVEQFHAFPMPEVPVWLASAGITSGPVFRAITRGGRVSRDAMAPDSVSRIIKKLAGRVGIDPALCSFASLRAVLIGEAVR